MGRRALVVDWNGRDLPSQLRDLPAGRYVLEAVDDAGFTENEARGVELALEQYRRGQMVDAVHARQTFDALLIGRDDVRAAQRIDTAIAQVIERLARHDLEGPLATLRSTRNAPNA